MIDQVKLRRYRLDRIRAELRARDYAGAVFADAINVRYATGSRNMQLWTMRSPARYGGRSGAWSFPPGPWA